MTTTFTPRQPIWCAGCGHFGVQASVIEALRVLEVPAHETAILAGIGCSGTMQNNISGYGYHATHGRVLPTATGMVVANPNLTVIASGGDGDGYAIGIGHLIHAFRRNPSMLYVVMNNGIYGLTKGQPSPTAVEGEAPELPLDAVQLGLTFSSASFIARGFVGRPAQLARLMQAALTHVRAKRGFAFMEVMSPCVTYNDTYPLWESMYTDIEQDPAHDPSNRVESGIRCARLTAEGRLATGLIYQGTTQTYEGALKVDFDNTPSQQGIAPVAPRSDLHALLERYYC